jgi:hypothetical protein
LGRSGQIFLIVGSGPAHISKKSKAFVATLGSRLKPFYLLAYSPDRNADELVCKLLKADTVNRMATTSKVAFKNKVISSVQLTKKFKENPLVLSEAFSSIYRLDVGLFMDLLMVVMAASSCTMAVD